MRNNYENQTNSLRGERRSTNRVRNNFALAKGDDDIIAARRHLMSAVSEGAGKNPTCGGRKNEMKSTYAAILLPAVCLHYLFVACLTTHSNGLKTSFLVCAVLVGTWMVAMFNEWGEK